MEASNHQLAKIKDLWILKEIKCPVNTLKNNNKEKVGKFKV